MANNNQILSDLHILEAAYFVYRVGRPLAVKLFAHLLYQLAVATENYEIKKHLEKHYGKGQPKSWFFWKKS